MGQAETGAHYIIQAGREDYFRRVVFSIELALSRSPRATRPSSAGRLSHECGNPVKAGMRGVLETIGVQAEIFPGRDIR